MEQCERHMASSAAHAQGERNAVIEVERLRRKLENEIQLRKAAESDRERMIRDTHVGILAAKHENQSINSESELSSDEDEDEDDFEVELAKFGVGVVQDDIEQ